MSAVGQVNISQIIGGSQFHILIARKVPRNNRFLFKKARGERKREKKKIRLFDESILNRSQIGLIGSLKSRQMIVYDLYFQVKLLYQILILQIKLYQLKFLLLANISHRVLFTNQNKQQINTKNISKNKLQFRQKLDPQMQSNFWETKNNLTFFGSEKKKVNLYYKWITNRKQIIFKLIIMLEVVSGQQILFKPFSNSHQKLKGQIVLKNGHNNRYIAYKIKSTNVNQFQADPSKGVINPRQTITIPIVTVNSVDVDLAKTLAQNNKFLIQYVSLNAKPLTTEQAISQLKSNISQSYKIYINTDSVRGSNISKTMRQPSAVGSNRYSFHSMAPNTNKLASFMSPNTTNSITPSTDQLDRLKGDIQSLQKQRMRLLKDIQGGKKGKNGSVLKYIILLAAGLVAGNLGSRYSGLNLFIQQKLPDSISKLTSPEPIQQKIQVEQQQGFFSIFNFGGSDHEVKVEKKKSFWDFL